MVDFTHCSGVSIAVFEQVNAGWDHSLLFKIEYCSKGTISTYPSQQRSRISSHLREKEELCCTIFLEKFYSVWQ